MKTSTLRKLKVVIITSFIIFLISTILHVAFEALDTVCSIIMVISFSTCALCWLFLPDDEEIDNQTKKEYIDKLPGNHFEAKIKDISVLEDYIGLNEVTADNVKCNVFVDEESKLIYTIQISVTKTTDDFKDFMNFLDDFEIT